MRLEMLGHDQPGDSHIHGASHVPGRANATLSVRSRWLSEQYRNEVPQRHHRDRMSIRVGCHPAGLSDEHDCACGKFGMKRLGVKTSERPRRGRWALTLRSGEFGDEARSRAINDELNSV